MLTPLHILIVDDSEADAELAVRKLKESGFDPHWRRVDEEESYKAALHTGPNLILSDNHMPRFNAWRALELLKESGLEIPFIVISGTITDEIGSRILAHGASDFLLKDRLGRLGPAVKQALERSLLARQQRMTRNALRESEESLRAFHHYGPFLTFIKDTEGRYLQVNEAFEQAFGLNRIQIIGRVDAELFPPEQAAEFQRNDKEVLQSGAPCEFEEAAQYTDGKHVSIVYKFPLRDAAGSLSGIGGIVVDITERRRIEDALLQSKRTIQTIFDAAPVAILGIDLQGRITSWNMGATRIFGWQPDEAIGRVCPTVPADGLEEFHGMIRMIVEKGPRKGMVFVRQKKSGERIQASINGAPLVDAAGNTTGVMVMLEDITERLRTEEELRQSEDRFRTIFEQAGAGIALVDPFDGRLLRCNRILADFLGYSIEELCTMTVQDVSHPGDYVVDRDKWEHLLSGEFPRFQMEKRYRRKNGQECWGLLTTTLVRDRAGKPQFVIGMVEDITELKRAEAELRAAEGQLRVLVGRMNTIREEEAKRIARELHDDLGQNLTALNMEIDGLREAEPVSREAIERHAARMRGLVNETIRVVQRITGELRLGLLDILGLQAAIEWLLQQFQERSGIRCTIAQMEEAAGLTNEQATAIFRVIQEALTNVARHSGATSVEFRMTADDRRLLVELRDNGRGITPEQSADRAAYGLLGMRERTHALGGQIAITGEAGRGTTVAISIPISRIGGAP